MSDPILAPDAFTLLLRAFNKLVEDQPPIEKVRPELLKLKQAAELHHDLNTRQKEAITDRVRYYLDGTYGKTKKPEVLQLTPAQSNGKQK
jgi:hypothetical protein